jgi:hypothetical protein
MNDDEEEELESLPSDSSLFCIPQLSALLSLFLIELCLLTLLLFFFEACLDDELRMKMLL